MKVISFVWGSRKSHFLYGGLENAILLYRGSRKCHFLYGGLKNAIFCMGVSKIPFFVWGVSKIGKISCRGRLLVIEYYPKKIPRSLIELVPKMPEA